MAKKRKRISERDAEGLKYFKHLLPLFERLHEVGCERDKAKNRQLHMDQYCALVLLFLFNPCLRSLRAFQQVSELKNVQRNLGCPRASLGSLPEATDVFDAERLGEIIGELAEQTQPVRDVTGVSSSTSKMPGSACSTTSRPFIIRSVDTRSSGTSHPTSWKPKTPRLKRRKSDARW